MRVSVTILTVLAVTLLNACAVSPPRPRGDVASWYGSWHQGRPTASGERYDMQGWTAAHPSLPLGTCVQVVNLSNGRHVDVRINDRGPYVAGRTIDLSYRAARELQMVDDGVAPVKITPVKGEKCVRPVDGGAIAQRRGHSTVASSRER
jgi:peptidoglycan lytic transglycosylase